MPKKNNKSFKENLNGILHGKSKKNEITEFISHIINRQEEVILPSFLKNYLVIQAPYYKNECTVKKIIELVFEELTSLAGDDLAKIKELYSLFNLLSLQKLSKDTELLQKIYKTLIFQENQHCSGLYVIVASDYSSLFKRLINLADGVPERIKYLYTALPLENKYGDSALNILIKETPSRRLNKIKKLIKVSYFKKIISTFMSSQSTLIRELNEIESYCLSCVSTKSIPSKKRTSLERRLTQLVQLNSLPTVGSTVNISPEKPQLMHDKIIALQEKRVNSVQIGSVEENGEKSHSSQSSSTQEQEKRSSSSQNCSPEDQEKRSSSSQSGSPEKEHEERSHASQDSPIKDHREDFVFANVIWPHLTFYFGPTIGELNHMHKFKLCIPNIFITT